MDLKHDDRLAARLVTAIHRGDVPALERLLAEHENLASSRLEDAKGGTQTPLHVTTDWPGYFPSAPQAARLLIAAGADPSARVSGSWHREAPLHWAASSDDADVAEALIDGGADIEADGGSIGGGTPLDNAVAYGCWQVAALLARRGARVDKLWHAAALGMLQRMEELLNASPPPTQQEISDAFWQACHGGQPRAAQLLLAAGADITYIPDYNDATVAEIAANIGTRREALVTWLASLGATTRPGEHE